jgi:hypothetical protein
MERSIKCYSLPDLFCAMIYAYNFGDGGVDYRGAFVPILFIDTLLRLLAFAAPLEPFLSLEKSLPPKAFLVLNSQPNCGCLSRSHFLLELILATTLSRECNNYTRIMLIQPDHHKYMRQEIRAR